MAAGLGFRCDAAACWPQRKRLGKVSDPIRGDHKLSPPHAKETRNGLFALLTSARFSPIIGSEKSKSIYKINRVFLSA
jgi:hypothetical protein